MKKVQRNIGAMGIMGLGEVKREMRVKFKFMGEFEKLKVWQLATELAVDVYSLVKRNPELKRDLRFAGQITSASVSIPSNIAEGDEVNTIKQSINYFYIAKGSAAELVTQLIIAERIGYISEVDSKTTIAKAKMVSAALNKMIVARKKWQ